MPARCGIFDFVKQDKGLFDGAEGSVKAPLADRMRPATLDEFLGQKHIIGPGKLLPAAAEDPPSMIFWGPPGSGKTTLARIIANMSNSNFVGFSAVLSGVKEIREIVSEAAENRKFHGKSTVLLVDEIHRFNKAQQDAFLPHVEDGTITLMGATTENPSFEVNAALLSRCQVVTLEPLEDDDVRTIVERALKNKERGIGGLGCELEKDALEFLVSLTQGDARQALNFLETAAGLAVKAKSSKITADMIAEAAQTPAIRYDRAGEEHYNIISAFIKSVRGSDPDAALYWMARMLAGGEDPMFIARRLVILASEDIGNADPRGLTVATDAMRAVHMIGMPEARIILAQATTYLAGAPKSNASYLGINSALKFVKKTGPLPVPLHLRNAPTKLMEDLGYAKGYKYPHDYPDAVTEQDYMPDKAKNQQFYKPKDHGYEKYIAERLKKWKEEKENEG